MDDEKPNAVGRDDPTAEAHTLRDIGGSPSDDWNSVLANQALNALSLENLDERSRNRKIRAAMAGLIGIGPTDVIEGMIGTQLIAAQNAVMECYRRATIDNQTFEGRQENLNQANKLSRTFALLLDTLNRHRGKCQQKVTVEHVHVHPGAQAVVGLVGTPAKPEEPNARQITHAPQSEVRCANPPEELVPIASDAERPMPNARRNVTGRTKGK